MSSALYILPRRLSLAVQRGNAASVLGTMKVDSEDEEFLYEYCFMFYFMFVIFI